MYKKAMKLHLRYTTKIGQVTTEELWSLKMSDLQSAVEDAYKEKERLQGAGGQGELSFLETKPQDPEVEQAVLRFEVLKDVYLTRVNDSKQAREDYRASKEIRELEEILADKKRADIMNMSAEDLEKLIQEKRNKLSK